MNPSDAYWRDFGLQVLVQSYDWNPETEQDDILGPSVTISIMLPVTGGHSWHRHECKTPEELWNVLRALEYDPYNTLVKEFAYKGPPKPPPPKSADDMLSELEGF